MHKDLDKALVEKYPKIFADRNGDMRETAMCWGFECGDGWYNIIDMLCFNIQNHIDRHENARKQSVAEGKVPTVSHVQQVVATQVKEKYGTLRFYYIGGDEIVDSLVRYAEDMSCVTCEVCGKPGKSNDGGWIKTLCDEHV